MKTAYLTLPGPVEGTDGLIPAVALPADAYSLNLRPEDAAAVSPKWRDNVARAIEEHGAISYRDEAGHLLGIFGCTSGPGWVSPWLLCDVIPDNLKRAVMRTAQAWTQRLRLVAQDGAFVANRVPRNSLDNRRFIRRLGLHIDSAPNAFGLDLFYIPRHV